MNIFTKDYIYWYSRLRVRQCWVQLVGCPDNVARIPVALNLLKYCSAFPTLWLAASQGLGYHHEYLLSSMVIAATINSLYSYGVRYTSVFLAILVFIYYMYVSIRILLIYILIFLPYLKYFIWLQWDLIQDWGLLTITRTGHIHTRTKLLYHWSFYTIAGIVNLLLRFSWKFNQLPYFKSLSAATLVLVLELLEIFRRALWNIIRIEWEVIVQGEKSASYDKLLQLPGSGSERWWEAAG